MFSRGIERDQWLENDTTISRHFIASKYQDHTPASHHNEIFHIVRTTYLQKGELELYQSSTKGSERGFRKFSVQYLFENYLHSIKISTENTKNRQDNLILILICLCITVENTSFQQYKNRRDRNEKNVFLRGFPEKCSRESLTCDGSANFEEEKNQNCYYLRFM